MTDVDDDRRGDPRADRGARRLRPGFPHLRPPPVGTRRRRRGHPAARPAAGRRSHRSRRLVAAADARPRVDPREPSPLRRVPHPFRLRHRVPRDAHRHRRRAADPGQTARVHGARPAQSPPARPGRARRAAGRPDPGRRRTPHPDPGRRRGDRGPLAPAVPGAEPSARGRAGPHPGPAPQPGAVHRGRAREEPARQHGSVPGARGPGRHRRGPAGHRAAHRPARRAVRAGQPLVRAGGGPQAARLRAPPARRGPPAPLLHRRRTLAVPLVAVGLGAAVPVRHAFGLAGGLLRPRHRGDRAQLRLLPRATALPRLHFRRGPVRPGVPGARGPGERETPAARATWPARRAERRDLAAAHHALYRQALAR